MIAVIPAREEHLDGWAALRHVLCDEEPVSVHRAEAAEQLADLARFLNPVALDGGVVAGIAEA